MNQWEQFYSNNEELKRAKRMQLKSIVDFLPAGMVIDQFQHWLYENPMHTVEERNQTFKQLLKAIDSEVADWSEHEEWQETAWLRILHIFEVPFYYVEYVIAQLGALQMYKAYKEYPVETLESYKRALTLGSSKGLADVYKTAGIRFDFSAETIRSLMDFIEIELKELDQ